jgi:3'(2'), 5'-bisphosphate nucleotidase
MPRSVPHRSVGFAGLDQLRNNGREPIAVTPPFEFASFASADLDELTAIASRAAAAINAIEPAAIAARTKSDRSPVTAADEAAESVVIAGLQRAMPGLAVISEEAFERFAAPSPGSTFALVDALDGTREFIAGRDEFTINLAIIVDGTPAIGVIAAPRLGLVWRGIVGRGAERLELHPGSETVNAHGVVPIHVRSRPAGRLVAVVSRSHLDRKTIAFLAKLPRIETIGCGSALKFCRIAEGRADLYPRLAPTSEWDVAAGHAILAAAGGSVTTPSGAPLVYGNAASRFRIPAFVAWGDLGASARD